MKKNWSIANYRRERINLIGTAPTCAATAFHRIYFYSLEAGDVKRG
ncbi:MAG: hypothetical protein R3C26_04615 [Calditrichia bacterium]